MFWNFTLIWDWYDGIHLKIWGTPGQPNSNLGDPYHLQILPILLPHIRSSRLLQMPYLQIGQFLLYFPRKRPFIYPCFKYIKAQKLYRVFCLILSYFHVWMFCISFLLSVLILWLLCIIKRWKLQIVLKFHQ